MDSLVTGRVSMSVGGRCDGLLSVGRRASEIAGMTVTTSGSARKARQSKVVNGEAKGGGTKGQIYMALA